MRRLWKLAAIASLLSATLVTGEAHTPIHEAGRCSIRGGCGSSSFFSPKMPCPDNGLAEEPEENVRKQLVDLCGAKWSSGPVCCTGEQVMWFYSGAWLRLMILARFVIREPEESERFYLLLPGLQREFL